MRKFIIGNWKMHGDAATAHALAESAAAAAARFPAPQVVLCPPATLIVQVVSWLIGSEVRVGGQDCHAEPRGAFTGDISAPMLAEAGCAYVIVGHSERRQRHGETDEAVRGKAAAAMRAGLVPVICIGETMQERGAGQADSAIARQISGSLPKEAGLNGAGQANFLLAYEPVWAIGSGKTPSDEEIGRMHALIRSLATQHAGFAAETMAVLYGGSVNAANAASILAIPAVGGVLVGGASLKAEEFTSILRAA